MKYTLLAIALTISAPMSAFATEGCDATYVTERGDSLKRIVADAYAAPMLKIVHAQNPHIDRASQRLFAGIEVYLPCLHSLPQFTPRVSKADDAALFRVALR